MMILCLLPVAEEDPHVSEVNLRHKGIPQDLLAYHSQTSSVMEFASKTKHKTQLWI